MGKWHPSQATRSRGCCERLRTRPPVKKGDKKASHRCVCRQRPKHHTPVVHTYIVYSSNSCITASSGCSRLHSCILEQAGAPQTCLAESDEVDTFFHFTAGSTPKLHQLWITVAVKWPTSRLHTVAPCRCQQTWISLENSKTAAEQRRKTDLPVHYIQLSYSG